VPSRRASGDGRSIAVDSRDVLRYILADYREAQPSPDITERDVKACAELERLHFYDSPDTVQAIVATDPTSVTYARYDESPGVSPSCLADLATVAKARRWIARYPRLQWRRPSPSVTSAATAPHG